MDIFTIWDCVLNQIKEKDPQLFTMFSTQIIPVSFSEDHMIIAVTKPYLIMWLKKIYWNELNAIAARKIGHPIHISVQILQENPFLPSQEPAKETPVQTPAEPEQKKEDQSLPHPPDFTNLKPKKADEVKLPSITSVMGQQQETLFSSLPDKETSSPVENTGSSMDNEFTFENFVYGNCNQLAYESALATAKNPSTGPNPLFIYGPSGLGKTHLLHAIKNYVNNHFPSMNVRFVTSETFTNDLITAIRDRTTDRFRKRYRTVDYLLIDDVQFFGIGSKDATKLEIFHTFNDLFNNKKHIIMTSDRTPNDIEELEDRLRSRFGSGLVVPITKPDFEICCAILQKKAEKENFSLPDDVIKYIALHINTNIRELEGAFNKVFSFSKIKQTPVTLEFAKDALKDQIGDDENHEITVDDILEEVCRYFSVKKDKLIGKSRPKNIVIPRQIAMYLCRRELDESYPTLAAYFHKKDHTTIIYACEKVETSMKKDPNLRRIIEEIKSSVENLGN